MTVAFDKNQAYLLAQTAQRGVQSAASGNNGWAELANAIQIILPTLISGAMNSSEANKENSQQEQAANNLKNSEETVKNNTNSKINEFKEKIEAEVAAINEKLEQIKENEQKKEEIKKQLDEQTSIIEEAAAYLNGEQSDNNDKYSKRSEAVQAIRNAGEVINGLNLQIVEISQISESVQKEISGRQSVINGIVGQMDVTVQEGNAQLQQLSNEGNNQKNQNNQLNSQGKATETKGQQEVATGETTQNYTLVQQGQDHQTAGQTLQTGAQKNNASVTSTQGLIKVDLTKLTADATSIGSIANQGLTLAEQVQSVWGVVGEWASTSSKELTTAYEEIDAAATAAEAKIGNDDSDKKQNEETDDYATYLNKGQASPFVTNKTFDYDVSKLRKIVSI